MPRASGLQLLWLTHRTRGNAPQVGDYTGASEDTRGTEWQEGLKGGAKKRRETMNGHS